MVYDSNKNNLDLHAATTTFTTLKCPIPHSYVVIGEDSYTHSIRGRIHEPFAI